MSERYTRIYTLNNNLYAEGAPVIIKAGALLRDNETGNILGQVKFENISQKKIIALKAEITAFDMADRQLGEIVEYQYLDLFAYPYSEFGSRNAIPLPDNAARAFSINVTEVVFDDKSIWAEHVKFEPIPEQNSLSAFLQDSELVKQYQIKTNSEGVFLPTEYKDLRLCSCGRVHKNAVDICSFCQKSFENLLGALDITVLTQEKDERVRQEIEAQKREEERRLAQKKKGIKIAAIATSLIVVVIAAIVVVNSFVIPEMKYRQAEDLLSNGDYDGAIQAFEELGDYKDVEERVLDAKYQQSEMKYQQAEELLASGDYGGAVQIFEELETYRDAEERLLDAKYQQAEGLLSSGDTAAAAMTFGALSGYKDAKERSFALWDKIAVRETISAGEWHTVGLKADGTVVAAGNNETKQCDTGDWTDITAVSAGYGHTVGLKADGTVVVAGKNSAGQCGVRDWTDIVAVSTGGLHTVGLKADGTVVAVGSHSSGQCNVDDWKDIIAVSAGDDYTVGLKADGTVVLATTDTDGKYNFISDWKDIIAISAYGWKQQIGLKVDGTVVTGSSIGDDWTDIVAVAAGSFHTVGLKADGTAVARGMNSYGECEVNDWRNIIAISAGFGHTVGLKADGTVVVTGDNFFGQCDVSGFTNIKLPE